ncbi:unnamed protein product, partial [Ixodes pacificus]
VDALKPLFFGEGTILRQVDTVGWVAGTLCWEGFNGLCFLAADHGGTSYWQSHWTFAAGPSLLWR